MSRLHPDDLRELARLIAEELREQPVPRFLSVKHLAKILDVAPEFVYRHAIDLGGVKLGDSPKAPWRFDLEQTREIVAQRAPDGVWRPKAVLRRRRQPSRPLASDVELLPLRRP